MRYRMPADGRGGATWKITAGGEQAMKTTQSQIEQLERSPDETPNDVRDRIALVELEMRRLRRDIDALMARQVPW